MQEAELGTNALLVDSDADGTNDKLDNCPLTPNDDQTDTDQDALGDVCDLDDDSDGIEDDKDEMPLVGFGGIKDSDGDGVLDPTAFPGGLAGVWQVVDWGGTAAAASVGPEVGSELWWSSRNEVRECWRDDRYIFGLNGEFRIEMDGSTFLEPFRELTMVARRPFPRMMAVLWGPMILTGD